METAALVVVCAKLTNPPFTGSFPGFKCIKCGQELQATAKGRDAIKAGGFPLCNKCGFAFLDYRKKSGKSKGDLYFFTDEMRLQMEETLRNRHDNN
jgi:hypothetical protein